MFPRPSRRVVLLIDAALVGWLIAWILIGLEVGREMRGLSNLSRTVVLAGGAIEQTGDLLEGLGRIPFVGGEVEELAGRIRATGRSARANARESRESIDDLSVLLAVSIALIPTLPLGAIYVPVRVRWTRDRRAVRRALARGAPGLDPLLADRARQTLPVGRLLELGGDTRALADAELERLGLRRP